MALGRGLSELLGEVEIAYDNSTSKSSKNTIHQIDVNSIRPNPNQPRKIFDEEKIKELSESIKSYGLLQPVTVISEGDDKYILVSGERRLRAHKLANMEKINAIVLNIDEFKLREVALIENIQRDDLNIIELAYSYAQLLNEHSITHEELSKRVSKSRTSITNTLRLLQLCVHVQQLLGNEKITPGHAKVLIGLSEEQQKIVADTVVGQRLSVRETEKIVKEMKDIADETKPEKKKIKKEKYNLKELNAAVDILKNDNLNVKLNNNYLKIEITSQDDIEKISRYFRNTL